MADPATSVEPTEIDTPCRVCRLESSLNIYNATFDTETGEVRLSDAFELFSSIRESPDQSDAFPRTICYECTNQLIAAYQFVLKVKEADQIFVEFLAQTASVENSKIVPESDEVNMLDVVCVDSPTFCSETICFSPESPIKHIDESAMVITGMQQSPFTMPEELLQTDDTTSEGCILSSTDVNEIILIPSNPHQPQSTKANIPPPKLISTVTSKQVRQDVAAIRDAKRRRILDAGDSDEKRIHLSARPNILDKLVVPHLVITDISTGSPNTVKTLEIDAVRISLSDLMELDLSDVAINEDDHPASPTTVFMCKYCPKAFATSHHLIVHTRRSHICQFCLKSFEGIADLHEHTRTRHVHFDCPFCPKEFHSNSNLRSHIKRSHSIQLPTNISLLTIDQMDASAVRLIELQTI